MGHLLSATDGPASRWLRSQEHTQDTHPSEVLPACFELVTPNRGFLKSLPSVKHIYSNRFSGSTRGNFPSLQYHLSPLSVKKRLVSFLAGENSGLFRLVTSIFLVPLVPVMSGLQRQEEKDC